MLHKTQPFSPGRTLAGASIFLLLMICVPVSAQTLLPLQPHPEKISWPTERWETSEMPSHAAPIVSDLIAAAIAGQTSDEMGETRAVVVIHNGRLVAEAYREGFGPDTKQVSWSMAKSITQALVGRAVRLGLIADIDAPMPTPFAADDPRAQISWRHWLNMTDGLDYKNMETTPFIETDVVQMMYGRGKYDMVDYIKREMLSKHEPGTHWHYSTEGYHLLGWALSRLPTRPDQDFDQREGAGSRLESICLDLTERIMMGDQRPSRQEVHLQLSTCGLVAPFAMFDLIGMDAQPEFDAAGTYLGGSLVWAPARDFAKLGYLYLRDGVWDGERLLPEGWVDFARTETPAENNNTYGAGWWVTVHGETPTSFQTALTPPWDAFNANGSEGQTIWVVPSKDLVIVRLGLMENTEANWSALFEWNQHIARAFPDRE